MCDSISLNPFVTYGVNRQEEHVRVRVFTCGFTSLSVQERASVIVNCSLFRFSLRSSDWGVVCFFDMPPLLFHFI